MRPREATTAHAVGGSAGGRHLALHARGQDTERGGDRAYCTRSACQRSGAAGGRDRHAGGLGVWAGTLMPTFQRSSLNGHRASPTELSRSSSIERLLSVPISAGGSVRFPGGSLAHPASTQLDESFLRRSPPEARAQDLGSGSGRGAVLSPVTHLRTICPPSGALKAPCVRAVHAARQARAHLQRPFGGILTLQAGSLSPL